MNHAPRVLLVTRRFWPLASDVPWRWLALASAMHQAQWQVEVVTAQWHSNWPAHVQLREFAVQRIYPSPTTPFRMRRAMRSLVDWIRTAQHVGLREDRPVDLILVDAAEDEATAMLDHARELPPIAVRYESIAPLGALSQKQRQRALSNCQRAQRVIVASEYARRELVAGGIQAGRVSVIYDAPLQKVARDAQAVSAARRALSDINHELFLRSDDRMCVCLADLNRTSGVEFVVRTLAPILDEHRGLRLWLVGDGPERLRLYDLLRREGWRRDVFMPGSFEDPDIVLSAADLCIVPSADQGTSWVLPTALGAGLTTFVCESPEVQSRLGSAGDRLSYALGDAARLADLFHQWCQRSVEMRQAVSQVCQHLWSTSATVQQYRELF